MRQQRALIGARIGLGLVLAAYWCYVGVSGDTSSIWLAAVYTVLASVLLFRTQVRVGADHVMVPRAVFRRRGVGFDEIDHVESPNQASTTQSPILVLCDGERISLRNLPARRANSLAAQIGVPLVVEPFRPDRPPRPVVTKSPKPMDVPARAAAIAARDAALRAELDKIVVRRGGPRANLR